MLRMVPLPTASRQGGLSAREPRQHLARRRGIGALGGRERDGGGAEGERDDEQGHREALADLVVKLPR